MKSFLFTLVVGCIFFAVHAQSDVPKLQRRLISINIIPGLGTTGITPGAVSSHFTFNLFAGYSYSNAGIELTGISTVNVSGTRGIQISGIANSTGLNFDISPYPGQNDEASLQGLQLAGVHNYVRDYIHGAQIAGLYNRGRNLLGVQVSAINRLTGFGIGSQIGILYNWAAHSFDGVQAGILINETGNRLVGLQLSALNIAQLIEGKNSSPEGKLTGFQIGLVNYSKEMHGFQFGLINISGSMRGTQIGLVNISSGNSPPVNIRNGTAIGLLNIGLFHSLSLSATEQFLGKLTLQTGMIKNGSIRGEHSVRYLTSSLEYAFSPYGTSEYQREFGIGLHKYYYNRSVVPGMNEKRFFKTGITVHMLQEEGESLKHSPVYFCAGPGAGYRLIDKLSLYVVADITINYCPEPLEINRFILSRSENQTVWTGFSIGLQLH